VRDAARLDRQRKLAEIMRQKADAEDRGEDVERQKNWEWTVEENDEWEKKQARKARRADFEFHSASIARLDNSRVGSRYPPQQTTRMPSGGNTRRTLTT